MRNSSMCSVFRYHRLRLRLGYGRPNFFVTNRGEKVVKIYDDVNKTFGARLSATLLRRMVETECRDHDDATSSGVAKALQHSEDTASRYYTIRQCQITIENPFGGVNRIRVPPSYNAPWCTVGAERPDKRKLPGNSGENSWESPAKKTQEQKQRRKRLR
jgi:hypothetical protein